MGHLVTLRQGLSGTHDLLRGFPEMARKFDYYSEVIDLSGDVIMFIDICHVCTYVCMYVCMYVYIYIYS